MEQLNVGYYAIIPAYVRYDTDIPANAKLLYGEITALCNKEGFCWATNEYFAKLYGFTKQSVSRLIGILADKGFIKVDIQYKENKAVEKRCISIPEPINRNVNPKQNCEYPINKDDNTYKQNCLYPINRNVKENNTSINTTSNNKNKYINNYIYNNTKNDTCQTTPMTNEEIKAELAKMKQKGIIP